MVKFLISLGHIYRDKNHWGQSLQYFQEAMAQAKSVEQQLDAHAGMARVYILQGNDAAVQFEIDLILNNYENSINVVKAIFDISEEYYMRGQKIRDPIQAQNCYRQSLALIENYILVPSNNRVNGNPETDEWAMVSLSTESINDPNAGFAAGTIAEGRPLLDDQFESTVWYVLGLNYWQLQEWFAAADAFWASIEEDSGHGYAGAMHWMISHCYEKLKESGEISCEEADPLIEWGYQTLFDHYSACPDRVHAAFELARINMARGRPVTAAIYVNWLLDQPFDAARRKAIIYRIAGGW